MTKKNRSIYVSENFYQLISEIAKRENRSMAGQLEYLTNLGITFENQLTKQEINNALEKYSKIKNKNE